MRVILIGISRDIEFDLRNESVRHLVGSLGDFYVQYRTGDIMARATNDLNAVRMMLAPGLMYWTETSLTMILAVGVMLWVDWPLALSRSAPTPLISFVVMTFGRVIHDRFERIQAMFSDISSRVQENLAGVRVIRAYTQEQHEIERFEQLNRDFIRENVASQGAGNVHVDSAGAGRVALPLRAVGRWKPRALRQHLYRFVRHVPELHGHAGVAHDRARVGDQPDAARQRRR